MKCPKCQREIQPDGQTCPLCGAQVVSRCPRCDEDVPASANFCPMCSCGLSDEAENGAAPGAQAELDTSVAKQVSQSVTGQGGASFKAKESVVRGLTQNVNQSIPGDSSLSRRLSAAKVDSLANIELGESNVVKSIEQNVNVNLFGAEDMAAILGLDAAGNLKTTRVFVACGRKILAYNPNAQYRRDEPVQEFLFPKELGAARSVRLAKQADRLMVLGGAHRGVVAFDAQSADARVYPFPHKTRYGVNATAVHGGFLYATHSDLGLLRWPVAGGEATVLSPDLFGADGAAPTVRAVQANTQGQLILCAGPSVYRLDASGEGITPVCYDTGHPSNLVGVVERGSVLYAASRDGVVFRWRIDDPHRPDRVVAHVGEKLYCLSLAQMPDGPNLVLGSRLPFLRTIRLQPVPASVDYRTADGSLIRWARGAADFLVAADRDCRRLLFWRWGRPDRLEFEVCPNLATWAKIMDICLLSQ